MVKVQGPVSSISASGGLGKTVIFSNNRGQAYVKRWAAPANPRTNPQKALRAITRWCSAQWSNNSAADRATWSTAPGAAATSPFNAYVSNNLTRWRNREFPTAIYPGTEILLRWASPTFVLNVQGRRLTSNIYGGTPRDNWGFAFFEMPGSGGIPPWDALIHVVYGAGPGPHLEDFGSFSPGTHYFAAIQFSLDGLTPGPTYIGRRWTKTF